MYTTNNGKDTKHTRQIARRMNFVRNEEKCKMHRIDWCEGGLQLADIGTKNVSEPDLTPIYFVHLALLSIPYKIHSSCNVSGMFGIFSILSHAHRRFAIQDNQRSFLWNHVWIFIQQFMN